MTVRYLAILSPLLLSGCYGLYGHDEVDRYFQRSDTITMSAGDAKQVNAVAHTIHPWPRYVADRRIAYDARRVGAAVTRYGATKRPVDQLPDIGDATKAMGQPPPVTTQQIITSDQTINQSVQTNAVK
ncbi:MAG: hypothetical protein Q7N95_15385 [Alphaproteobacteria bacterium]|nr:hypothetical protein [Alphaproteobacteria bacterium]